MPIDAKALAARFAATKVLVVDDEHYMRKVVRTLLMSIGVRTIYEAPDGPAGLEFIRSMAPDVVILDWEMPGLDGAGFVRMVRSPDTFPFPDVPIIMLTGHGERRRVIEAVTDRRQRIPAQAGVVEGAAGSLGGGAGQSAPDGSFRRLLRAGAAQDG